MPYTNKQQQKTHLCQEFMNNKRTYNFLLILFCIPMSNMHAVNILPNVLYIGAITGVATVAHHERKYYQAHKELQRKLQEDPQIAQGDRFNEPFYDASTQAAFRARQQQEEINRLQEEEAQLKKKALVSRFLASR